VSLLEPSPTWSTWEELERDALACTKCPLATAGRTQVVFGVGSRDADLVFVGEGPGAEEDKQGIPFVGRAGQLLTKLIEGVGMTRDEVYIANVVKCRPPGNRDPMPEEIETCRPYLEAQLSFLEPKVIVTLGNFSTKLLLETKDGITKLRGKQFKYPVPTKSGASHTATLIPTLHPAAVLRGGGTPLAQTRADFVLAKRALAN
jgi:uracil-DNA glycosylase